MRPTRLRRPLLLSALALCVWLAAPAAAQSTYTVIDTTKAIELQPVVVTATRSVRMLEDVPVPTQLITAEEAALQGAVRLTDLLQSQTGLNVVQDFSGSGLQVQGLDADYTLVLIDGEPVIGRTAGTLDLERLSIGDVERIEVVRGPSSSLYGSEALAGVVNLITRTPDDDFAASARMRYGTHRTLDTSVHLEGAGERVSGSVFVNRYSSDGYQLTPGNVAPTVPAFTDYTVSSRLRAEASPKTELGLSFRLAQQDQESPSAIFNEDRTITPLDREARRTDWSLAPRVTFRPSTGRTLRLNGYAARFGTDETLTEASGAAFYTSSFDQQYLKAEALFDALLSDHHFTTVGAGGITESVEADRFAGGLTRFNTFFAFAQHEWAPSFRFDVIGSLRLDAHSEYGTQLSPKVAAQWRATDRLSLRSSVGTGFKAPDFRQLYLDFLNAEAGGYRVLGTIGIQESLAQLRAQGVIAQELIDPSDLRPLEPETSLALNAGLGYRLSERFAFDVNLFRNTVDDLIETVVAAVQTNGQQVFTYTNLREIYTQGLEAEVDLKPVGPVTVTAGYQYLDARETERDRRLGNRSRHSGRLHVRYDVESLGLTALVRAVYRGSYLFAFASDTFVDDYTLWNVALTKRLGDFGTVQAGVDNLLDTTQPLRVPSLSGRLWFAGLTLDL